MKSLTLALLGVFAAALNLMLRGAVVAQLWLWFIVPMGAPVMLPAQGMGLSVLVSLLTFSNRPKHDPDDIPAYTMQSMLVSIVALGLGWIVFTLSK